MFISIVNSTAFAGLTWIVFAMADADLGKSVFAIVVVFLIALITFNMYSHLVIHRFTANLHVRIDMGRELSMWAARQ